MGKTRNRSNFGEEITCKVTNLNAGEGVEGKIRSKSL
jgi:hypothetical protein